MSWHARLQLDYTVENNRSVARFLHHGPLRILQSLYPEGDAVCHNVLVHPPGGLVGGDRLDVSVTVGPGAHGLVTTPGATRFYRSEGGLAEQRVNVRLESGARLEWLPMEAIAHSGCDALNRAAFDLAPGAEFIGWDVTALGLPNANAPFDSGRFAQHLELQGAWLERGRIDATDHRLLDSPLGLAGHRCLATLFFLSGSDLARDRRAAALEVARHRIELHTLAGTAGATAPNSRVVVVRVLSPMVEPAMGLLRQVWAAWRAALWLKEAASPRIWST
jgi:urease accessory protein